MAIFHITPATSRFTNAPGNNAFGNPPADDSPGADTLIVDPGASLIATANESAGAFLVNTGAWTATVNGLIVGGLVGVVLGADNIAVSTIKIGVDGEVQGGDTGVALGSSASLNNAGTIIGGGAGIVIAFGGTHVITNSGTITGGIQDNGGGNGNDTLRNSGIVDGSLTLSTGNDTVTNAGVLSNGDVSLGDGTNHLTNSGEISGDIVAGSGNDTVTNSGTIDGQVTLGDGNNTLTNSGTITSGVLGGSGTDTVTDFAIVGGVMQSGKVTGVTPISLGDGNDKFSGGANREVVKDGNGADTVSLGGGDDTYVATGNTGTDAIDVVRGGAGIDTYNASDATNPCAINLDTVAHDLTAISPSAVPVAANTANGLDIAGTVMEDTIFGFERVAGGQSNDVIYGSAASNNLFGNGGNDFLAGFGGNDTLDGGNGNDDLFGGAGKDVLTGGAGADVFHYTALSDSGITAGTRDLVADFQQGSDKIDLSAIDANTTNDAGTNDTFIFIGTNTPFIGFPGQLHAFFSAIGQIIEGDVNGDKKPDFSIEIQDPTHAITLSSGSFFL